MICRKGVGLLKPVGMSLGCGLFTIKAVAGGLDCQRDVAVRACIRSHLVRGRLECPREGCAMPSALTAGPASHSPPPIPPILRQI